MGYSRLSCSFDTSPSAADLVYNTLSPDPEDSMTSTHNTPAVGQDVKLNTPALDEDIKMNFLFDVVEDPMDGLDAMVSLGETGSFHEARLVYKDSLERYSGAFPIFAEYLRLLYDQGDFNALKDAEPYANPSSAISDWHGSEREVIDLLRAHGRLQYHQNSKEIHRAVDLWTKPVSERVKGIKLACLTAEEV
jgi:hypothetical protein